MANLRDSARLLAGAVVVYGLVAACSSTTDYVGTTSPDAASAAGAAGAQGAGGSAGAGATDAASDGFVDAVVDAISEPVPDAVAADGGGGACACPAPTIVSAQCDFLAGGTYYARADFPGKSMAQLYGVRAYVLSSVSLQGAPVGYSGQPVLPILKDGQAAVNCGANPTNVTGVDFWLP